MGTYSYHICGSISEVIILKKVLYIEKKNEVCRTEDSKRSSIEDYSTLTKKYYKNGIVYGNIITVKKNALSEIYYNNISVSEAPRRTHFKRDFVAKK